MTDLANIQPTTLAGREVLRRALFVLREALAAGREPRAFDLDLRAWRDLCASVEPVGWPALCGVPVRVYSRLPLEYGGVRLIVC